MAGRKAESPTPRGRGGTARTPRSPVADKVEKRGRRPKRAPVEETLAMLRELYPDAHCELVHDSPFQLLVATVLSAQTTDVNVNKATPALFAQFPDAASLARAEPLQVEPLVSTLGFFRQKAKNIVGLARRLVEQHGGQVPRTLDQLVELPGVGRKTANVVLGVAWKTPEGVVVDTHVQRISQRLGWSQYTDPLSIERDLMKAIPRRDWDEVAHLLVFHGRRLCTARKPGCEECMIHPRCPSAFVAETVGRKPRPRARIQEQA